MTHTLRSDNIYCVISRTYESFPIELIKTVGDRFVKSILSLRCGSDPVNPYNPIRARIGAGHAA